LFDKAVEIFYGDKRVRAMWLHGAFARGTADAASDLDISVAVVDETCDAFATARHERRTECEKPREGSRDRYHLHDLSEAPRRRPGWLGPVIYRDDLVSVSHRATGPLGYVYLESRRHVAYLDQLSDAEAAAIGWAVTRVARGLRAELDVEFVHTFVSGRGVAHFHQHVFARHAGTPKDHPWWPEWDEAPHGDVQTLADRLSGYFRDGAD
jgi:ATP adenylyltransferase